jgi:hypothetical protein
VPLTRGRGSSGGSLVQCLQAGARNESHRGL